MSSRRALRRVEVVYFEFPAGCSTAPKTWIEIPSLGPEEIEGRDFTCAGRDLLAFNGIVWDGFEGTFLNETWLWNPELRDPAARP